ncbi:MAG: DNA (cytosine-5-)-methyltransferase [Bacteroidales bacterium]|nr:DNA (cytosine-5-)-methyltransferase [Bacteroidales bacterium]
MTKGHNKNLKLLSLFSGCGGMDIGFEGGFITHRKSIDPSQGWVDNSVDDNWVKVKDTRFVTVFANDILEEARNAWLSYMTPRGHKEDVYHFGSIVDYVKKHKAGQEIFPQAVDIVTGGFPCQDFSVAGKRLGFDSHKDHTGHLRSENLPTEETRGKLYCWMKEVIEITQPKMFVAENVRGLVNLGDVKTIIQKDFASAGHGGYIVLTPRVLHAADYGVPESRERVIFIGIRKNALTPEALDALSSGNIPAEYDPYPLPTHNYHHKQEGLLPTVTCGDIFAQLPEPEDSDDLSHRYYSKAKFMGAHCQGQKEISLNAIGPTIRSEHHGNIEFRRLSPEHGGCGLEKLPERRLTPRECALIQTFPPDYEFVRRNPSNRRKSIVSPSGAYKVIGNAVPPVLAYNIALRLQELWPKFFGDE